MAHHTGHRFVRRLGLAIAVLLCLWATFGISAQDDAAIRAFDEATQRWAANTEFRSVSIEYCVLSHRALRTRPLFVRAPGLVLAIRSIPFLPKQFAANPTSRPHYENFGKGPLSAYLHLSAEQSVPVFAGVLEGVGKGADPSAIAARHFLDAFHMDFPVCHDAGARQSVESLMRDVEPRRPLTIRENIAPLLMPHVRTIARRLRVPDDPANMSPEQQLAVLERLDARVRQADPELWRTKQLSDFCCGVWAQVFAPSYRPLIEPVIVLRQVGQLSLTALLLWLALGKRIARRRHGGFVECQPECRSGTGDQVAFHASRPLDRGDRVQNQ